MLGEIIQKEKENTAWSPCMWNLKKKKKANTLKKKKKKQ